MEMERGELASTPKHLRTGLDMRAADAGGLATLLIAKGVFTELEYIEAIADAAEREQKAYEERLSHALGAHIRLG
jgi:hypothetical protein